MDTQSSVEPSEKHTENERTTELQRSLADRARPERSSRDIKKSVAQRHVLSWDSVRKQSRPLHRILLEKKLGRKLLPTEIVHHKDHNKHNNNVKNFEITTRAEHNIHHKLQHKFCTMADCRKAHHAQGLCNTHHKKIIRAGGFSLKKSVRNKILSK